MNGLLGDGIVSGETAAILSAGAKGVFFLVFKKSFDFPEDVLLVIDNVQMERPILEDEFRSFASAGKMSPGTFAIRQKMSKWLPLSSVSPELAEAAQFLSRKY